MTDEIEKQAEKYAKENGSCFSHEYGIRIRTYMDCAELREKQIAVLKQENAELKYNLKCRDDELAESKAEIKQIIEREHVVPEHYLCEMIDKNKELKAQNEKLKCCQMCKHLLNGGSCLEADTEEVRKWDNFLIETRRKKFCKNWELPE